MKLCKYPGCCELVDSGYSGYCEKHKQYEIQENERKEYIQKKRYNERLEQLHNNNKYCANKNFRSDAEYRRLKKELLKIYQVCQICGNPDRLEIHHILKPNGNKALFNDINNLIVVCHRCHKKLSNAQKLKH